MSGRNPFAVLGLTPEILRRLQGESVVQLAKASYRQLALIHHPDRGGSEASFKELAEAWSQIDPDRFPIGFEDALTSYLKPKTERLEELRREANEAHRRSVEYQDLLIRYWRASIEEVRYEEIGGLTSRRIIVPAARLDKVEVLFNSFMEQTVRDKVKEENRPRYSRFHRLSNTPPRLGPLIQNYSRMITLDESGTVVLQDFEIVRFDQRKGVPEGLVEGWTYVPPLAKWGANGWRAAGKPYKVPGIRVIGVLEHSGGDRNTVVGPLNTKVRQLLPSPTKEPKKFLEVLEEGFDVHDFANFLPQINPYLGKGILVAISLSGGVLRFRLLGRPSKIRIKGQTVEQADQLYLED